MAQAPRTRITSVRIKAKCGGVGRETIDQGAVSVESSSQLFFPQLWRGNLAETG